MPNQPVQRVTRAVTAFGDSLLAIALPLLLLSVACCSPTLVPGESESPLTDQESLSGERTSVAFYNLENLFDTDDDPSNAGDDEYLPQAQRSWTVERYLDKLTNLSSVIAHLGGEADPSGPALLGVCEVENQKVLDDLARQPVLAAANYQVVHRESPDYRGIDCALLYRPEFFQVLQVRQLETALPLSDEGEVRTTRDVLYVKGLLQTDTVHVFVNHWPSRRGGEARSRPGRLAAARTNRVVIDSILSGHAQAQVIVMGDLNDDPINESVRSGLRSVERRDLSTTDELYNPMVSLYRQGEGTLGYRDRWNLFDQILVSPGLAHPDAPTEWTLQHVRVLRRPEMLQREGRYRGYPFRTYVGPDYLGGYSDHLPVYAILARSDAG